MRNLRIVFMGTPAFAVPSLEILLRNKYDVKAVVTAPDKPQGRGQQVAYSPVKAFAIDSGLPVMQPLKLKEPEFLEALSSYKANLFVVVAFRMLPQVVWAIPEFGTINLHASLLPQYRGAAPINWAIINGEEETGVTTFFISHDIDTGAMIFQEKEAIQNSEDAGALHDKLMLRGANLVLKTVQAIERKSVTPMIQSESSDLKKAPKIFREQCRIDWHRGTTDILNFIRGLSPAPGAWTDFQGKTIKIFNAAPSENIPSLQPGTWQLLKNALLVKTADGAIALKELQPEGRRRMTAEQFLAGNR